jgi:hypothetical protein
MYLEIWSNISFILPFTVKAMNFNIKIKAMAFSIKVVALAMKVV